MVNRNRFAWSRGVPINEILLYIFWDVFRFIVTNQSQAHTHVPVVHYHSRAKDAHPPSQSRQQSSHRNPVVPPVSCICLGVLLKEKHI